MENVNRFLCHTCGSISEFDNDELRVIFEHVQCRCNKRITMDDSYPNLKSMDLYITAKQLYDSCVKQDQDNKNDFNNYLNMGNIEIDDKKVEEVIVLFENNKEKYNDNDRNDFIEIFDEFEKAMLELGFNTADIDVTQAALAVTMRNKMRKPYIIMAAATIENLFNDYFYTLIDKKFNSEEAIELKEKLSRASIYKSIKKANTLLEGELYNKMDNIFNSFTDKWRKVRDVRNEIIHNNNQYITADYVANVHETLTASVNIFLNLKSDLYKETYQKQQNLKANELLKDISK